MAHTIDETTEVRVSLKSLAVVIIAIVSGAAFMFHIEERLDMLDHAVMMNKSNFENYKEMPSRGYTDIEVMKKEIEYLQKEVDKLEEKWNSK